MVCMCKHEYACARAHPFAHLVKAHVCCSFLSFCHSIARAHIRTCAQVTLQKDKNSKEAQKAAERAAKPPPTSGLDAFLAEVEKKKKVGPRYTRHQLGRWAVLLFFCCLCDARMHRLSYIEASLIFPHTLHR